MNKSSKIVLRQILSELMVNLAAGWYGAAVIIPISSPEPTVIDFSALTANLIFGTVCMIISYKFRMGLKKNKKKRR